MNRKYKYKNQLPMEDNGTVEYFDDASGDFVPPLSQDNEWMGRSIESLVLGNESPLPILSLPSEQYESNLTSQQIDRDSLASSSRTSSIAEMPYRSSLNVLTHRNSLDFGLRRESTDASSSSRNGASRRPSSGVARDGTVTNYINSNLITSPTFRRRSSTTVASTGDVSTRGDNRSRRTSCGPNIALSMMAREMTGRTAASKNLSSASRLRKVGGKAIQERLDHPAGGIVKEVKHLEIALNRGDWVEIQTLVTGLAPRLVGDLALSSRMGHNGAAPAMNDPSLPRNTSRYYAGGGRLGVERDAFFLAGGVEQLIRVFQDPSIVGENVGRSNDARDLTSQLVANKFSICWNEVLASLRELVYAMPALVHSGAVLDDGAFLPFLFTLLAHDSCFDGAAALIEEILSLQSHSPPPAPPLDENDIDMSFRSMQRISPATTFMLGNVPNLYGLWQGFNCRQLAHFCRVLALLVFEPEDRQLLESPSVLKSVELLQLRRDRASRAGRDATVDMNQSILLGDRIVMERLLRLLKIINYAPSLRQGSSYHVMAHFPFVAETLIMLGLSEMDNWGDIERLEMLARDLIRDEDGDETQNLSELGGVASMLESLSGLLMSNPLEPSAQLGHIIHVINAAQQAGVVVGGRGNGRRQRSRRGGSSRSSGRENGTDNGIGTGTGSQSGGSGAVFLSPADNLIDISATATALNDEAMMRRTGPGPEQQDNNEMIGVSVHTNGSSAQPHVYHHHSVSGSSSRFRINNGDDAANELQFNALLLAPYQVEVLFVLCTLLGGRRKLDAQSFLHDHDLVSILDDMFHRLSWGATTNRGSRTATGTAASVSSVDNPNDDIGVDGDSSGEGGGEEGNQPQMEQTDQPTGIHGPGCECTPESALSVQYLRLLHNFCDRDCDNYNSRRLLLSQEERDYVFSDRNWKDSPTERPNLKAGLFSKILKAFMEEADDSPYRFWLASCAESYLRGSSPHEQIFAARSGLLLHLVEDVTSDRLHCAGSLQTSFDLLGEVCKGNAEVLYFLVSRLDEERFRKLMSAAVANLVDSNVFLRSLLLSVERISASRSFGNHERRQRMDPWDGHEYGPWLGRSSDSCRYYLTHSWWDSSLGMLNGSVSGSVSSHSSSRGGQREQVYDNLRTNDWFPAKTKSSISLLVSTKKEEQEEEKRKREGPLQTSALESGIGYNGWLYSPSAAHIGSLSKSSALWWACGESVFAPNTMERLAWFLMTNQAKLLRDLLNVVDLRNINHENICCLNTAVVVTILASRRCELISLLNELSRLGREEEESQNHQRGLRDRLGREMALEMEMQGDGVHIPHFRSRSLRHLSEEGGSSQDLMKNFRELVWFWSEYYTHRGRDRLSLEFSSHLRFDEWFDVVNDLTSDDGSIGSLVSGSVTLPRSPYRRAARIVDTPRVVPERCT